MTDAIVTASRRYGEADKLLVLFTLEKGRLSAIAKSARKPKSSLRGASESFVRAKFELAVGRTLDIVRQVEILDPHLGIRESWRRLQFAGHVAEIVNKMSEERMPDEFQYNLLSDTLVGISNGRDDAVVRFKASLLDHMGVFPDLSACAKCGTERVTGDVHLAMTSHGFLCSECAKDSQVWHPIPMKVLHILHSFRNGDETDRVEGDDVAEALGQADDVLTTLLQAFLQQGFKTSGAAKHARKLDQDRDNNNVRNKTEPQ